MFNSDALRSIRCMCVCTLLDFIVRKVTSFPSINSCKKNIIQQANCMVCLFGNKQRLLRQSKEFSIHFISYITQHSFKVGKTTVARRYDIKQFYILILLVFNV